MSSIVNAASHVKPNPAAEAAPAADVLLDAEWDADAQAVVEFFDELWDEDASDDEDIQAVIEFFDELWEEDAVPADAV